MIATLELHDGVAPGEAPRQAYGAHGGFRARVDHAHQVHAGHDVADTVSELYFQLGGCAEAEPFGRLADNRFSHVWVIVAHEHRAPGQHVVDVAFPFAVVQVSAVRTVDEHGGAAHGLEGAYRGVHTPRDVLQGALEKLL